MYFIIKGTDDTCTLFNKNDFKFSLCPEIQLRFSSLTKARIILSECRNYYTNGFINVKDIHIEIIR